MSNRKAAVALDEAKRSMATSAAMNNSFLRRFEHEKVSATQLRCFAVQWYKTARGHKEAFPWLVANTRDDDVRFDLVEILREEYGNGDRRQIHSRLLWRFLSALGIREKDVEGTPTAPSVEEFSNRILEVWREGNPVVAFGLHFALEYTASAFHVCFARGLRKYPTFSEKEREYFEFHSEAEKRHADVSELGWEFYASQPGGADRLAEGVALAVVLMSNLWAGFLAEVFGEGLQPIIQGDEAEVG